MNKIKHLAAAALLLPLFAGAPVQASSSTAAPQNGGMALGLTPAEGKYPQNPQQVAEEEKMFKTYQTTLLSNLDKSIVDLQQKRTCIAAAKDLKGVQETCQYGTGLIAQPGAAKRSVQGTPLSPSP